MTIPKFIHQTFTDFAALPSSILNNIERIKQENPTWEYCFYDNKARISFIENNYGSHMTQYYLSINPNYGAARADLFRYLIIYKKGGIYVDIKAGFENKLDDVIAHRDVYLLSHWHNGPGQPHQGWGLHAGCGDRGEFQQWHIVAAPGHPFLKAVIQTVLRNIDTYSAASSGIGPQGIWSTTGPIAYTKAITPLLNIYHHTLLDIDQLGFKFSVLKNHWVELPKHYQTVAGEPIVIR